MKKLFVITMLVFSVGVLLSFAGESSPQTPTSSPQVTGGNVGKPEAVNADEGALGDVGTVLIVFLVLSVVFEVALTPIFNWRVFMVHFEGKGYKVPITVALAFIVFWGYGLDIIRDLLVALNKPAQISLGGQILTALLIAGGSSGVFQIFTKLGIRIDTKEREKRTIEARKNMKAKKATSNVA